MKMFRWKMLMLVCVSVLSCVQGGAALSQVRYTVTDLGTLGGVQSVPLALNNRGQVVGYARTAKNQEHAFLYSNGKMRDISFSKDDLSSQALSINDNGEVVGWVDPGDSNRSNAFFVSRSGVTSLLPSTGYITYAAGINNNGLIVGTSVTIDGGAMATYWENGVMTRIGEQIDPLDYGRSGASAVNDAGQIAGGIPGGGFIWQRGKVLAYAPGGLISINAAGAAVGSDNYNAIPYLVQDGTATKLNVPSGLVMYPNGLNIRNQIVGSLASHLVSRAFLYENGATADLNKFIPAESGWFLETAQAINDVGQIVGIGTINGAEHAFLLTLIPGSSVPATTLSLAAGYDGKSVDGIVCDNLRGVPDNPNGYQRDYIKITVPKDTYPDADFSASQVLGENNGHFEAKAGELDYYPPDELNTNPEPSDVSQVDKASTRKVMLNIRFKSGGKLYSVDPKEIVIARPPVVLVHGINSNSDAWFGLIKATQTDMGISVPFALVDHHDVMDGNGPVEYGASQLHKTIQKTLESIRQGQSLEHGAVIKTVILTSAGSSIIYTLGDFDGYTHLDATNPSRPTALAIRRVDVVGWSYGGVITRWFLASDGKDVSHFSDPKTWWYQRSYNKQWPDIVPTAYDDTIRKFLTLGSMWRGLPLVNYLNEITFNKNFPSPSGVDLGDAPVRDTSLLGVHNLRELVNFIDGNFTHTYVPSMEVMAINSPWQSKMIFRDPFQIQHPLYAQPFSTEIAYGSVAGDNDAYLGYDGTTPFAPYAVLPLLQKPSWFPFLKMEHIPFASRNYSDGLVPIWSAAIPGSYKIAPVDHSNYPNDRDTQKYLVQWLNNAKLPLGATLNGQWNTSVQSADQSMNWSFSLEEMAPHYQNVLYPQFGGIGRINPSAIQGNDGRKPVIKMSCLGSPVFNTRSLSFTLSVSNTGAPAHGLTITKIAFYQNFLSPRLPYILVPGFYQIDLLGPPQTLVVSAFSQNPITVSPLFCTISYQCYDQQDNLISGQSGIIKLK